MNRREFIRKAGIGAAAAAAAPAALSVLNASPAFAMLETASDAAPNMVNMGVGMYTDMSTAFQMSTFSIEPMLVTCGVGTFGQSLLGGVVQSGPFAMLMYSLNVVSFNVDHVAKQLTAMGRMRSITRIAGVTREDVEHDFLAIATDTKGVGSPDRFDVHFVTPFWTPGLLPPGNPMATASTVHPGWSRFGGTVVTDIAGNQMGGVTVT